MTTKRVIFTGQSGIKIREAISGFKKMTASFARGQRPEPLFFSLEDKMLDIYLANRQKSYYPRIWIAEIFSLPYSYLQDLWEKAFLKILEEIKKTENKDIFINFHACFYHHDTVEYLSFVRETLLKGFNPDLFVTLIDDIYDIHARLRETNQIFHTAQGGASEPIGAILELFRILDWRSKEIMLTRHFASQLNNIPHYVFAVKHSYETLYKLIYEDKPTFYISHPISEVRRLQRSNRKRQADTIIDEIRRFQNKMSSEFTCFLPTTIDELRIDFEDKRKEKVYLRKLMPRWDKEKYKHPINLLFSPPSQELGDDPLWDTHATRKTKKSALLLNILHNHIEIQMSTRDHKLVEQSQSLAVYRPCFNGNPSGGVLEEMKYYKKGGKENCFIYLPKKDQRDLEVWMLEKAIWEGITEQQIIPRNRRKSLKSFVLTDDEKEKVRGANVDDINGIMSLLDEIIETHNLRVNVERNGLQQDRVQQAIKIKRTVVDRFISSFKATIDIYKETGAQIWEEDNLTPEVFVDKIVQYFSTSLTG